MDDSLKWLDENTDWDIPEEWTDIIEAESEEFEEEDTLYSEEELSNILDCVTGLHEEGEVEYLLVLVGTMDDDQLLLTNIQRNDLIMGALYQASHNWHKTQTALQELMYEGGENEDDCDEGTCMA